MNKRNLEKSINGNNGYHPFFIVVVILLVHIVLFFKNQDMILHQITLRDFDGYWHLAKAKDLYNFGNTYHTTLSRSNAPYGEILHWTSSFDLMLYIGAYIGSFFVNFNVALLWWSIIINPILHVLTFLVLFWGLRDFIGDFRASIFGILLPFQIFLIGIFETDVPDHHGAQIFLFALFIALIFKSIVNGNLKIFSFCGIVGGISIWFGLESIAIIIIAITFFGLEWIIEGETFQIKNLIFSFTLLLTAALTLILDTSYENLVDIIYDRISIIHVFLFFIITLFWLVIFFIGKWKNVLQKNTSRFITAAIGSILCLSLMFQLFPLFFKNPLSEVNSTVLWLYLKKTDEFTGLFSENETHAILSYIYWAMTLPALPVSIFLSLRKQSKERIAWIFITILNIVYIVFSALIFRMSIYAILCALIPISYIVANLYMLIENKFNNSYGRILRTIFILVCCFSFLVPATLSKPSRSGYLFSDKNFLYQTCQYLNDDSYFEKKPRRILTSMYLGPLLFYKTQHEVIGTPSHRNVSGILDTYYIMNAQNEHDAHTIIRRRGIEVIMIGRPEYGISDYFNDDIKRSGEIFHHQLWNGNIPSWLQAYPVPQCLSGKIKVFLVVK